MSSTLPPGFVLDKKKKPKSELPPGFVLDAPAPPPPPEEEQGFIDRSLDRLQLGLSDTMSTLMGDTYGRSGDPTERDDLPVVNPFGSNRLMKALGGDIIPAVGDVAGDALISGGKAVLPESAEQKIAEGAQRIAQSDAAQSVGRGLESTKEFLGPENTAYLGEAANILGATFAAATPVARIKPKIGEKGFAKLRAQNQANRKREVSRMIEPDYKQGVVRYREAPRGKAKGGPKEWITDEIDERVIDRVSDVPGVDPRRSYTHNMGVLDEEVTRLNSRLIEKLKGEAPIPEQDVTKVLDDVLTKLETHPTIVGNAEDSAQRLRTHLDVMMKEVVVDGKIMPDELLILRQKLDRSIKSQGKQVKNTESGVAFDVATKDTRQAINNLVNRSAPKAGVAEDLSKQSDLLTALDVIDPRHGAEARTSFGQYLADLERSTGVRHPVTPQAMASGGTDPRTIGLSTALALGHGMKRGGGKLSRTMDAHMKQIADDLIKKGVPATAAILAAMQDEEE